MADAVTLEDRQRYNPGPDPDDSSYSAFCSYYECRYDVMPHWWWDTDRRDAVYLQWQRRKEADQRATKAALLGAKRVFDELEKV